MENFKRQITADWLPTASNIYPGHLPIFNLTVCAFPVPLYRKHGQVIGSFESTCKQVDGSLNFFQEISGSFISVDFNNSFRRSSP